MIPWVFHRRGEPIRTFRRAWLTACVKAGFGYERREPDVLDDESNFVRKGKLVAKVAQGIPHDFRRSAVRSLERAGVPRSIAMALVGHKTESIYRRYAIADETTLREGADKLAAFLGDGGERKTAEVIPYSKRSGGVQSS